MKGRKGIAFVVALSVIAGLSALALFGLQNETAELNWALTEGDELDYNVSIYALNLQNATHELENPESFLDINNTVVHIDILDLPQLPYFVNPDVFIFEVISKTNISIAFPNGSILPEEPAIYLGKTIEFTLLPVGNWDLIDNLFQDEDPDPPFMQTWYFSRLYENHLEFGYTLYGPDYANGWKANISLDTGIPLIAEYWSTNVVEDFSYHLVLTLKVN